MNKTTIITILCIIIGVIFVYWFNSQMNKSLEITSEANKQEWLDYKTRCEELGGLPSKQFVGYRCDK